MRGVLIDTRTIGGGARSGHVTHALRFRIFRAIQDAMHATGDCPLASDLALDLHLDEDIVVSAMRALRYADGLPFSIPDGAFRRAYVDRGIKGKTYRGPRESESVEDVYARFERLGFA